MSSSALPAVLLLSIPLALTPAVGPSSLLLVEACPWGSEVSRGPEADISVDTRHSPGGCVKRSCSHGVARPEPLSLVRKGPSPMLHHGWLPTPFGDCKYACWWRVPGRFISLHKLPPNHCFECECHTAAARPHATNVTSSRTGEAAWALGPSQPRGRHEGTVTDLDKTCIGFF
jgi:hypothetical protein